MKSFYSPFKLTSFSTALTRCVDVEARPRMKVMIIYPLIWCLSLSCDIALLCLFLQIMTMGVNRHTLPPGFKQEDEVGSGWKAVPGWPEVIHILPAPSLLRADIAHLLGTFSCHVIVSPSFSIQIMRCHHKLIGMAEKIKPLCLPTLLFSQSSQKSHVQGIHSSEQTLKSQTLQQE